MPHVCMYDEMIECRGTGCAATCGSRELHLRRSDEMMMPACGTTHGRGGYETSNCCCAGRCAPYCLRVDWAVLGAAEDCTDRIPYPCERWCLAGVCRSLARTGLRRESEDRV